MFYPIHLNCPSNPSHPLFDYKIVIIVWSIIKGHKNLFWTLVPQITVIVCSFTLFACLMIMITGSFIIFTDTMKSHTIELLLIIIIIIINIKFCGIIMKLPDVKHITIIIMIIAITINIIKYCSIAMKLTSNFSWSLW